MKALVRNRRLRMVAALLLAALASSVLDGFLSHTDDGCAVETHCLACRSHIGSTAVVTPVSALTFALHAPDPVLVPEEEPDGRTPIPRAPSRAPPLV